MELNSPPVPLQRAREARFPAAGFVAVHAGNRNQYQAMDGLREDDGPDLALDYGILAVQPGVGEFVSESSMTTKTALALAAATGLAVYLVLRKRR